MATYGNRLRARLDLRSEPQFGQKVTVLPDEVLEIQFQEKLTGGFNRKHKCPIYQILLPSTGQCDYC